MSHQGGLVDKRLEIVKQGDSLSLYYLHQNMKLFANKLGNSCLLLVFFPVTYTNFNKFCLPLARKKAHKSSSTWLRGAKLSKIV